MDTRDIVELTTLISGVVVSVAGAVNQIRQRRAGDAELKASAGADALARGKAAQGIGFDTTHTAMQAELETARRLLREHGITEGG